MEGWRCSSGAALTWSCWKTALVVIALDTWQSISSTVNMYLSTFSSLASLNEKCRRDSSNLSKTPGACSKRRQ